MLFKMSQHKTRYVIAPLAPWFNACFGMPLPRILDGFQPQVSVKKAGVHTVQLAIQKEQEKLTHIVLVFAVAADFSITLLNISLV